MVFFFLIPSIPAVLGNFLVPMMIGARDLAFPKLNLLSWYIFMVGGCLDPVRRHLGRRGYGLDVLHAAEHDLRQHQCAFRGVGSVHRRVLLDSHRPEFRRHHPQDARARHDLVPHATVSLGDVRHQPHPDSGNSGGGHHPGSGGAGAALPRRHFRSRRGWRPHSLPALVLVLFASGRLHHDSALHGRGQRIDRMLLQEAHLRL